MQLHAAGVVRSLEWASVLLWAVAKLWAGPSCDGAELPRPHRERGRCCCQQDRLIANRSHPGGGLIPRRQC